MITEKELLQLLQKGDEEVSPGRLKLRVSQK